MWWQVKWWNSWFWMELILSRLALDLVGVNLLRAGEENVLSPLLNKSLFKFYHNPVVDYETSFSENWHGLLGYSVSQFHFIVGCVLCHYGPILIYQQTLTQYVSQVLAWCWPSLGPYFPQGKGDDDDDDWPRYTADISAESRSSVG